MLTIFAKLGSQTFPETSKNRVLEGLGTSWESLGATWGHLGRSWRCFGRLGEVLGASWVELGASWKGFGASWEALGGFLGGLGGFQGPFWKYFSRIFLLLKQYMKIAKNIEKPMVFH